jgi:streptogramin lyase
MRPRALPVLACVVMAVGTPACTGDPASTGGASVPRTTQPEPESAAPVESKLPGADAFEICAAAGDFWPTMVAAAAGSTVWIACKEESRLVPVDAATGRMGDEVVLDASPIAVVSGFGSVWALDSGETLYRLDPDSGEIASRIDVAASAPYNLWTGADSVWTIDDDSGEVIRVSPETEEVVARVTVGDGPADMVFSGTSAWVVNHRDRKLLRIDTKTNKAKVLTTLRGTGAPERLALLGGSLWVTGRGTGLLEVNPDTGEVLKTVDLDVSGIDVVSAADALWVPTRSADVDPSGFPTASDLKRVSADGTVESIAPTEPFDVHGLVADDTSLWLADTTDGVLYKLPLG